MIPENFPRVSDIIGIVKDEGLEKFREGVGEERFREVLDAKAGLGRTNHDHLSRFLATGDCPDNDENGALDMMKAFGTWMENAVEEVVGYEQRLNNFNLKYTGQYDLVVRLKGDTGLTLIDYKFRAVISKACHLQLGGYALMFAQKYISRAMILQFVINNKTKTWKLKPIPLTDAQFNDAKANFMYARQLYQFMTGR